MDPSIIKLLEEDKDDSIHSENDVAAFQASLNREIEGKNHSSSQQSGTGNNGTGDANTNLHILESTQMKEQHQRSVSGNQNQELKRENESHLQHLSSQDHHQPGQLLENAFHVPKSTNLQSRNNHISTQRAHGVEQPVGPVHHGPEKAKVCELLCILVELVDEGRKMQLRNLYWQFKRQEIKAQGLIRQVRHVVGEKQMRLALSKLHKFKQGNKGIEVPEGPNHYGESFTSAETSAKNSDPRGVHVSQVPSTSSGTLSSSATEQALHNFERPTSVDGLSSAHGGLISHFQNNSSLPLYSAPCQGSATKDQTMGPSSSAVHEKQKSIDQSFYQEQEPCSLVHEGMSNVPMKQSNGNPWRSNDDLGKQSCNKMGLSTSTTNASFVSPSMTTQMGSSTMVNFPAPSGNIPAEAKVRKTPKKPSVGRKKPLDALGSSLPPSSKKQKTCQTSLDGSMEQFNDVTALGGINLEEEEKKLLVSGARKHGHVSVASRRFVHEEEERRILQKVPLQRKLAEISWVSTHLLAAS
ncbi:unnamed protein product [Microthlaspi erraticum]|uniref:RST domain-containing protein n=1 Tax=Microthlaspi erraticum TaxID=1685480 RepID=A0A6D2I0U4_9BRAS|nr:unnamed protein product [Microthlaspi erraticum]